MVSGSWPRSWAWTTPRISSGGVLEFELGPIEVAKTLERICAQRETEAWAVWGMHGTIRANVEGFVEELPHHWHVALADLEDMTVCSRHRHMNACRKQHTATPGMRRQPHTV